MGLADGMAWERVFPQKYYTCHCVVTEIKEIRIPCNSREEYEEKIKKMGHKIAPLSVPYETNDGVSQRF